MLRAVAESLRLERDNLEAELRQAQETIAAVRKRAEVAERMLSEWVTAHDAEREAAKTAARVRVGEYAKWPPLPRRIPSRAVPMSSLPPEEQRRIADECAREMAPINEAEAVHREARTRLAAAVDAARAALAPDAAPSPAAAEGTRKGGRSDG
jgi:hypothetical protein